MVENWNLVLFVCEAVLYFAVMTALLHLRHRIGLGVFLTALGVMHFVETYLAAVFYVSLPFGVVSPGSSVFFAGKLMMILMLYIQEDASIVRQPIYGLFLGNLVTLVIAQVLMLHQTTEPAASQVADMGFLSDMGLLMLWGTTLLYVDALGIILLYERLGKFLPRRAILRFGLSGAIMLSFDQVGFYALLSQLYDAPAAVLWGGWKAKMVAVALYAGLFALYQFVFRGNGALQSRRPIRDIFSDLTFRERYEDLLARTGRDVLTGVYDRSRMEIEAPRLVRESLRSGVAISLVIVDVDHFKSINDRFGHLSGDDLLRQIANALQQGIGADDHLFRYGGEEFVILLPHADHEQALSRSRHVCAAISETIRNRAGEAMSISLGVATAPEDGSSFNILLAEADERLYMAKNAGRNRVVGRPAEQAD
ncbi:MULTISPECIES: GGDEF domain-containing protein [Alphaproteobacteria]|uniref:diguanylate cyclase n=2 Tax=Alphaproteobacteria TaxID=28211 RepID=A0A512HHC6_9HYPH|nr:MULTISPECIES: GGDEF domain-containing protein [Alphaproteobacteria]GEO84847.1 GGDEF domain-containing protein [Ciceribacter naphthalenivorans]GLR22781.1 GGDEF domain-containing protein [Ciceribacter naphthalenivorans]GLT05637.1 GGDEF domain-containing protein [Sphingomonas psychrolutea]